MQRCGIKAEMQICRRLDSANDITVVSREDGSGTRGAFIELFGIQEEVDGEKVDMTTTEAPDHKQYFGYDDNSGRK